MVSLLLLLAAAVFAGFAAAGPVTPPGTPCIGPCPGYPLPPRRQGFSLTGSPSSDVHLEMYGDNLCSFTKAAFTTIDLLAQHYADKSVEIRVHWFPLPFHHNAYFVAMADHWVGVNQPELLWPFARAIFAQQGSFFGKATTTMTPDAVKQHINDIASNVTGINMTGFKNFPSADIPTRVAWKTATSRGMYETPSFYLNGFRVRIGWPPYQGVAPEPAASNLTVWTTMIDALLETPPY